MEEYIKFFKQVQINFDLHPEWRLGQNYFNSLYEVNSKIADSFRGGILDPFHKNDPGLLIDFLTEINKIFLKEG